MAALLSRREEFEKMNDPRLKEEPLASHSITQRLPFEIDLTFGDPIRRAVFSIMKKPLESIFQLNKLNNIYRQVSLPGEESLFPEKALESLNVSLDISKEDRLRIPSEGPVVIVANHPFGAIEGIVLSALLKSIRPDFKILANYLLDRIIEMRPHLINVDPFGSKESFARNIAPLKEAIQLVRNGGLLGVFPSGEVAHLDVRRREVSDPEWSHTVARIVRKTGAQVVPVYFDGRNSNFFQLIGLIHPRLRTALLPRELINKRNRSISIRVGKPISNRKMVEMENDNEITDYLRMRTYLLGVRADTDSGEKKAKASMIATSSSMKPIAPPDHSKHLSDEIDCLPEDKILARKGDFVVYQARMQEIPRVMREIGRLREITFRDAGEGTGKAIDLDKYDTHYIHLFAWNKEKKQVIGAYRLGPTDIMINRLGLKGLYTASLFNMNKSLMDQITPAIELGRSFIRQEYQREYAPLNLLWKGIGHYIAQNPRYKMLFGPVSISNTYQSASRQLLVSFLTQNKLDAELTKLVRPKTPLKKRNLSRELKAASSSRIVNDLNEVSALIAEIEADRKTFPILLKHYLKLGGKLLGFNIDSEFADVLDGLILVDLTETPGKILEKYMGKEGYRRFMDYHQMKHSIVNIRPAAASDDHEDLSLDAIS